MINKLEINKEKYIRILEDAQQIADSVMDETTKEELMVSILATMATEFLLETVYETLPDISYYADNFADETFSLRMPYMNFSEVDLIDNNFIIYTVEEYENLIRIQNDITTFSITEHFGENVTEVFIGYGTELDGEIVESSIIGVKYTNGKYFVYGNRKDREVEDEMVMYDEILCGF